MIRFALLFNLACMIITVVFISVALYCLVFFFLNVFIHQSKYACREANTFVSSFMSMLPFVVGSGSVSARKHAKSVLLLYGFIGKKEL